ncbi:membrane-associated oxidoreductase [Actinomadura sp. 7K507]|uniref:membrane-associated oxidoreductase n=1 Tax=Actinomadura sp. 7K507 TaxID=2530365 RepID=UPI00104E0C11|nr:membrane-associated oxidoreductase [Actinomadura sp. 7K507]TDC97298.1 membrane-associated oxidoreductase [Actinomadura sp. 7K507]
MEPIDLTPVERRVWRAFPTGTPVDLRDGTDDAPERGDTWAAGRTVRAWVLRKLLLSPPVDGEIAALRVVGARVTGALNLQYAAVDHPITLRGCHFEETPVLYGARFRQVNLSESYLPGLDAATLRVDGVLRLTDCRVPGQIRLGGARLSGVLFLERARLGQEDGQEEALHLNHSVLEDDVWGPGLEARGEVRLNGASVAGVVNLEGAVLRNPGGRAFDGENLTAGSDVNATRARFEGEVSVRGATIPGLLVFTQARLSHPAGCALRTTSAAIGEVWLRDGRVEGTVNMLRGRFGLLHVPPGALDGEVWLDGLTYESLTPRLPAKARIAMLERDAEGYVPHAYEQLTAAYRQAGDDRAARNVMLAKQRRYRATRPWYARLWGYLQDVTVGYGFRPVWAAGWLAGLLLAGAAAFGTRPPDPLKPGEHPPFNALFYTLDLLLPIIDFGQEKAFKPVGGYQWLAYGLIITGWVLATTIAAGITRTLRRQ